MKLIGGLNSYLTQNTLPLFRQALGEAILVDAYLPNLTGSQLNDLSSRTPIIAWGNVSIQSHQAQLSNLTYQPESTLSVYPNSKVSLASIVPLIDTVHLFELLHVSNRTLHNQLPPLQLNRLLLSGIRYWTNLLVGYNISSVFYVDIPHSFHDNLICSVACALSIPTNYLRRSGQCPQVACVLPYSSRKPLSNKLFTRYVSLLPKELLVRNANYFTDSLLPDTSEEKDQYSSSYSDTVVKRVNKNLQNARIHARMNIQDEKFLYLTSQLAQYLAEIRRISVPLDKIKARSSVIFFLSRQPEASTSPEASLYADQFIAIQEIRSRLDPNIALLIKEHPNTFRWHNSEFPHMFNRYSWYRDPLELNILSKIQGIKFIDPSIPSQQIIKRIEPRYIVTSSGTVSFQSLALSIPAVVTGNPWYTELEGIISFDSEDFNSDPKLPNGYSLNSSLTSFYDSYLFPIDDAQLLSKFLSTLTTIPI